MKTFGGMRGPLLVASAGLLGLLGAPAQGLASCSYYTYGSCPSDTAPLPVETSNRVQSQSVLNTIGRSVENAMARRMAMPLSPLWSGGPGSTGLNAGDATGQITTWGTASYNYLKINPDLGDGGRSASNMYTGIVAGETSIGSDIVVGVALSYLNSNTNGHNSNGTAFSIGDQSYSLTPYIGWRITDHFMLQGMIGGLMSHADADNYATGAQARSKIDSHMLLASSRFSYLDQLGPVNTRLFVAASANVGKTHSYTDSLNVRNDGGDLKTHYQGQVGGQLSYVWGSVEPFVELAYVRDSNIAGVGENSAQLATGFNAQLSERLSLSAEGNFNFGRQTQSESGGMVNLRTSF